MEVLYVAVGALCFLSGALIAYLVMHARQERQALARRTDELERRVTELAEQVRHLRLTHSEVAAIEDATANLIAAQIDAEAMLARHATAYRILLKLREGPHAYKNCEWGPEYGEAKRHGSAGSARET